MNSLLVAVLVGTLPVIAYCARIWLTRLSFARQHGCGLPPARRSRPLLLRVGSKIQSARTAQHQCRFPAEVALFHQYGQTYRDSTLIDSRLKTCNAENIQSVFGSKKWGIGPYRKRAMGPFCGDGFITNDGPVWEHSRSMLKPSFHRDNIADLGAFEDAVKSLIARIPGDGSTVDFQPLIELMFVDTSTQFLLGHPIGVFDKRNHEQSQMEGKTFLREFNLSIRGCGMRVRFGRLGFLLPKSETSDHWRVVHQHIDSYVDKTLKGIDSKSYGAKQLSLLESLAQQTSDRLEMRNQVIQGMMAASENVPILLSNTIFLLSRHPAVWKQLRDAVLNVGPQVLDLDTARRIKPIQNILNESLRLYPLFAALARVALVDTVLPSGGGPRGDQPVFAPAGTEVRSDFYALHRHVEIFGDDVDEFRPDRWNDIELPCSSYMPFGAGMRTCLGRLRALGEASCVLIRLAQAFEHLHSRDNREWFGDQKLVTKNLNGCKVAFTREG